MRQLTIFFFLYTLLFSVTSLADEQKRVALVGTNANLKMAHRIEGALLAESNPRPMVTRIDPLNNDQLKILDSTSYDLVITLGPDSAERALNRCVSSPILGLLLPHHLYYRLKKNHPLSHFTALFIDQPIGRQLDLIQSIMLPSEQNTSIGIILGPDSSRIKNIAQEEAYERNLSLKMVHIHQDENPISGLGVLIDNTSYLLALADDHVYNPYTARGILLATFRKKVPLISHTYTYVRKGALAAVYSSPQQIADDATQFIMTILNNEDDKLPLPRYPKQFSVAVNYQAAQSLDRTLESEHDILKKLIYLEEQNKKKEHCKLINHQDLINN